ncbi:MAG TPA: fatty acid cis/trans isomerase, partial [Polyangiaceae bacterium]|nr:fatty acid cis/trans isomerase [Polyangiaceae bacterium]
MTPRGNAARPALFAALAFIALALASRAYTSRKRVSPPAVPAATSSSAATTDPVYASTIQPLFDQRCVVCHSCFDAPCQLNLQSFEGVDRGANPKPVYMPLRPEAIAPTRMFQDAQSTRDWQAQFGFFPVLARSSAVAGDPNASLLYRMVEQRLESPGGTAFDAAAMLQLCPKSLEALDVELRLKPERGMPFGFPPLATDQVQALANWIRRGAPGSAPPSEGAATSAEIDTWEAFFNADDPKTRLVARYLFEHLAYAHVRFESAPGEWFRLVRSRTKAPEPLDEIATVRPYDDPKSNHVYYRLRRLNETVVEKTHIPYLFNDAKLARIRQLFLNVDWGSAAPTFPSYDVDIAANPFVAFGAIPARSRYQFMLDDALYHVKTFIDGPVCRGQIALNVIDEHFLIFFLSPDTDPAVSDAAYLPNVASNLALPALGGDGLEGLYARFKMRELQYLKQQASYLRDTKAAGRTFADIWNGDGNNPGAVLTVYRHNESAFVLPGATGGVPKTAWVLDYPIFERMYYDLVAGFDVFGNVIHQFSTRRYMNLLRIEAEDGFLRFLPQAQREPVRKFWYRGAGISLLVDVVQPFYGGAETRIAYDDPAHAKDELIRRVLASALPSAVVGEREPVQWADVPITGDDVQARFERAARRMVATTGPFVRVFPDTTLLRVRAPSPGDDDLIYTIVRNRAHLNIDFMFLEPDELVPAEDTLHVVRGIITSRPNFFLAVDSADVDHFVTDVTGLTPADASWSKFLDRYGTRRADPKFWSASDFFNTSYRKLDPINAGILDLSL